MKTAASQIIPIIKNALNAGHIVQALGEINIFANEPLKMHEYEIIDRLIYENKEKFIEYIGREPIKVAVLGGYTTRYICKALNVMMLAEGLFVNIYESEYNLYKQEVLNSESGLYRFKPEIVLFATGSMNIHQFPSPGETADTVTLKAKNIIQEYEQLWTITRERTNAQIIQNNFVPLEQQVLGRLEGRYPWSQNQFISQINTLLWKFEGKDTRILDVCELATRIGLNNWYDPRLYHHGKIGFNPQYLFEYCRIFIRLYRAVTGSTKKCLVTDLDNTLWGGIIGDDGLEGIELGNVSAKGEAYEAFCCYLKNLKDRGVILAVNSKNDLDIAKEVFVKHPNMPLKVDDFSIFCCNWDSKSINLRNISKELNIGLDSIIFIDDNPVECAEVIKELPEVRVVEMADDPSLFIRKIDREHFFDQLDLTTEDLERSKSYLALTKITELRNSSSSLKDFLNDLEMTAEIKHVAYEELPRIEQLIKKTNQFNLTNRKYDSESIKLFMNSNSSFCISFWLRDKIVNYGLISVVIAFKKESQFIIDNWVMSCRVFSRTLEQFIFNHLLSIAKQSGCSSLRGQFIVTKKNNYARDLYSKLGFICSEEGESSEWLLEIEKAQPQESYILGVQAEDNYIKDDKQED